MGRSPSSIRVFPCWRSCRGTPPTIARLGTWKRSRLEAAASWLWATKVIPSWLPGPTTSCSPPWLRFSSLPSSVSSLSSSWPITWPWFAAATSTSHATWPRASRWNNAGSTRRILGAQGPHPQIRRARYQGALQTVRARGGLGDPAAPVPDGGVLLGVLPFRSSPLRLRALPDLFVLGSHFLDLLCLRGFPGNCRDRGQQQSRPEDLLSA